MPAAADLLDAYPELRFPAARGAVQPREVAVKWGVTTAHVYELLDDGTLAALDMTGRGNKSERQCLRIPVSSYYALTRERLKVGWRPAPPTDARQQELPGFFADHPWLAGPSKN